MKKTILFILFVLLSSLSYADITTDCTNVVALYHLDGNATDSSGNGNDGTVNGATYNSSGKVNGAFDFDGDDDYVDSNSDININPNYEFTFSLWFKNLESDITKNANLLDSNRIGYLLLSSSERVIFRIYNESGLLQLSLETPPWSVADIDWHHIVGKVENISGSYSYSLWLDGNKADEKTMNGIPNTGLKNLVVGWRADLIGDPFFNGSIDELIIYNKALNSTEVGELHTAGLAGTPVSCGAPCVPDCVGKSCGDDNGCGGLCTVQDCVNVGETCVAGVCVATPVCGNSIIESGEICENTNLAGQTCITQGFIGGNLSCNNCLSFDTSACTSPVCIDNDNDWYNQSTSGCGVADCDDTNFNINPGIIEDASLCENGLDDDCVGGDLVCGIGKIHTAISCNQIDVQNAIDLAVDGDTVIIPECSTTLWSSVLSIIKAITLQGNGKTKTLLQWDGASVDVNGKVSEMMVYIHPSSNKKIRITGISFNMVDMTPIVGTYRTAIGIYGSLNNEHIIDDIRIDNNNFNKGSSVIFAQGYIEGVIDNNLFINPNLAVNVEGDNDYAWSNIGEREIKAGTSHVLFIESNNVIYNNDVETNPYQAFALANGARSVIRYNIVDGTALTLTDHPTHFLDIHGNQAYFGDDNQQARGMPIIEVYKNKISIYEATDNQLIFQRSGSLLMHDNNLSVITGTPFTPYLYEEEGWYCPPTTFVDRYDLICRTDDGTSDGNGLWPAQDQITNTYFWNNICDWDGPTCTNGQITAVWLSTTPTNPDFIQEGRDYHFREPSVSGTNCVYTGRVGGSTTYPTDGTEEPLIKGDTGMLSCSSTGADAYYPYTPYTYPHPLRQTSPPLTCNDNDKDGYGNPASNDCTYPTLDCNDNDQSIHPNATETCNLNIDDNCDLDIQCHRADDNPIDGCIEDMELDAYVLRWFVSSQDVSMSELISAIRVWKAGC